MKNWTLNNVAAVILLVFIAVAVTSSFYNDYIKEDETDLLRQATIHDCQRAQTRSQLDQRFALEAAKARRRNAETYEDMGNHVKASNEIATAKVYEKIAQAYEDLTTVDCTREYPES